MLRDRLGRHSGVPHNQHEETAMITGAHSIVYSTNPDADRAILRDVFNFTHVDVGGGWLIFGLPPGEVAVHPSDKNDVHELYLMCDDINAFVAEVGRHNLKCAPVQDEGWGLLTHMTLPGGGKLGIYQPRHARPAPMKAAAASKRTGKKRVSARRSATKRASATRAAKSRTTRTGVKRGGRARGKKTSR
jgi:hypothetical protein